jgi:hypothetical protein
VYDVNNWRFYMKKWIVVLPVHASTYVRVEAETEEEAIEEAFKHVHVGLCHQCSDEIQIDEIGHEPYEVSEVEE